MQGISVWIREDLDLDQKTIISKEFKAIQGNLMEITNNQKFNKLFQGILG